MTESEEAIARAFPEPMSDNDYRCVIAVLSESMSQKAITELMCELTGRAHGEVFSNVGGVQSIDGGPLYSDVEACRARLVSHGWVPEVLRPVTGTRAERRDMVARNLVMYFDMISEAFSAPLASEELDALVWLLNKNRLSAAMVANVVQHFTNRARGQLLSDVRRVREFPPQAEAIERVRKRLGAFGFPPARPW